MMARIHRNLELDQHFLKEVWHNEVVGFLHVLSVVEPTKINVVMAIQVASSVVKRVTS